MTINKWLNADKVVESFMLYCYSKLSDEQIEDNLVEFREDMRSGLYKKLKRENPLPNTDSFHDEEVMKLAYENSVKFITNWKCEKIQ